MSGSITGADIDVTLTAPALVMPSFDLGAILAVSVPLAVLVIGPENAQAIGTLMAATFRPPTNVMTLLSGLSGAAAAGFGGHTANIAGPMTAICSSREAGPESGRYAASVVNRLLFVAFGAFAGVAIAVVTALPSEHVSTVAGLAMITVLLAAFQGAFRENQFQISAFFALVIAMSDVTIFSVSSPFWALIGGVAVSLLLESGHLSRREDTRR